MADDAIYFHVALNASTICILAHHSSNTPATQIINNITTQQLKSISKFLGPPLNTIDDHSSNK
jgi:hypothetical protein